MKKLLLSALSLVMVLSSAFAVSASESMVLEANDTNVTAQASENVPSPRAEIVTDENAGISPRNNFLIINNEDIYTSGKSWTQPGGYIYYRVNVTNTRSETMTLIIAQDGAAYATFSVPANGSITINGSEIRGNQNISFSTPSGVVSGKINVRVSDLPL